MRVRRMTALGILLATSVAVNGCATQAPPEASVAAPSTAPGRWTPSVTPPAAPSPTTVASPAPSRAPGEPALAPRWKPSGADLVAWSDPGAVPHLFYHSLIVDPGRAFKGPKGRGYRDYMVTIGEFRAQLRQLHDRGYVLVHPERLAGGDNGDMRATPLLLPQGKKPLVLSVDDVNYYDYMTGDGFASDLFFDADGRLANHYTDAAGAPQAGSFDVAPIIDDFVRDNPDFSYDGDKGTLAVTGYNGVLGYRSSVRHYGDTQATHDAAAKATEVATEIKRDGWNFASHSWGHLNFKTESLATLKIDAASWDAEVRPVVGPTREFVFPFGADISDAAAYSSANPKYAFLHDAEGFSYIFPIDATRTSWAQVAAGSLRQARINVDGLSITRAATHPKDVLWTFFDPTIGLDPDR